MHTPRSAIPLTLVLLFAPLAHAQGVKPDDRNAALRYSTIAYYSDPDPFRKAGEVDMSQVAFDPATAPADFKAAADALKNAGDTITGLIETTKLQKCDFEIPWEQGADVLLPHLGKMRANARLLRVDARRLAIDADPAAAAERLAAMFRMSRHATADPIIISSLVGAAISSLAIDETESELAAGKLTRPARDTILAALNALPKDDPFAMKAAIHREESWIIDWIEADFRGPDAGKKLVATGCLDEVSGGLMVVPPPPGAAPPPAPPPQPPPAPPQPQKNAPAEQPSPREAAVNAIGIMNEQQLHAAAERFRPYYDKVIAAWNKPDAPEQLKAIAQSVERGDFGPLAQFFVPAAVRAHESCDRIESRITALKAKLATP